MVSNDTLFAQVIALDIAKWEPRTKELCYRGIRHSLHLNNHGVPKISESLDLQNELTAAVEEKLN